MLKLTECFPVDLPPLWLASIKTVAQFKIWTEVSLRRQTADSQLTLNVYIWLGQGGGYGQIKIKRQKRERERVRNIHKIPISLENSHWLSVDKIKTLIHRLSQRPVVTQKSSLYLFCLSFQSLPVSSQSCKTINLLEWQSTPGPGQGVGKIKSFIKTQTPQWT